MKRRQYHTPRASRRRARPQVEFLEERLAPTVNVIENFESGNLNSYVTRLRHLHTGVVANIAAHDGIPGDPNSGRGLVKNDGYEWLIRNDVPARVSVGQTFSVWVNFANAADGRAYFGFGATPNGNTFSSLSAARQHSIVIAANTNQLILENNNAYRHTQLAAVPIPGGVLPNHPYRLEVQWNSATGASALVGRLYDTDGTTVLATVTGAVSAAQSITTGGISFRAFGSPKWFDTVVVDTDGMATPAQRATAGGGLDPAWTPGTAPTPRTNGPSTGPAPVPWAYTSLTGSNRDVSLLMYNQLTQASGGIIDGMIALAGQHQSGVTAGTTQIGWGPAHYNPPITGPEVTVATPLVAQYLFIREGGTGPTRLIGTSDVQHFFNSAQSDLQHLNPGQTHVSGAGVNLSQVYYSPGSELDPVTGALHRNAHFGAVNNNGINQGIPPAEVNPHVHLLRVRVEDLDPAMHAPGTQWFAMGALFVEGDQNVNNNSRWVRFVPTRNGSNFTFTYPDGTAGQLDFRTIPGLPTGLFVADSRPSGNTPGPVSNYQVTFNRAVNAATFTASDVTVTGPSGSIAVTGVTPVSGTNNVFNITFAAQSSAGIYTVTVGPNIEDTSGGLMDQNGDGTPGDGFTGTFILVGSRVTAHTPTGLVLGPITSVNVTFDRAINASSFTTADIVSFVGPEGPISVTSVTPVSGSMTQFDIGFPAQNSDGLYTLILGPDIMDTMGAAMDQDQDGVLGEVPQDRYTATFNIGCLGPEGFGYVACAAPFESIDLVPGAAGVITLLDDVDDAADSIPLGTNTFNYYGTTFTGNFDLNVSTNGLITFVSANGDFENTDLTSSPSQRTIAVLWDDWVTDVDTGTPTSDQVLYKFEGIGDADPSNDRLIIEWQVYRRTNPSDIATFQAILYLNTGSAPGTFVLNYPDLFVNNPAFDFGADATVGIKFTGVQGARRLLVNLNSGTNPLVQSNRAIRFSAAGVLQFQSPTFTVNENESTATIAVRRSGGNFGAISVNYATSNGTATAGQDYTATSGTLNFAAGQTTATFTIPILDDTLFEGNETVNLMLSMPTFGAVLGNPSTAVLTIVENDPQGLRVTSFTPTNTGFIAQFSQAFDISTLNLYDGFGGMRGEADVTVVGSTTGSVGGSLVIDPSNTRFTFIRTGGLMPSGAGSETYTVTFRSAANAFKTPGAMGTLLDGNGDGMAGDNYTTTFTVNSSTAVVVSIPDFARGPEQPVHVSAAIAGLPIFVSDPTGITSLTLNLRYNTFLLRINGATTPIPGASASVNTTTTPGVAAITFTSPTPLTGAGVTELVRLDAVVPNNALYNVKHVLNLDNISLMAGAASVATLDDDGLHAVLYVGDTNANGGYTASDANRALQFAVGLGTGYATNPNTDPNLVSDVNASGTSTAGDATNILRKAVGLPILAPAIIPDPPTAPSIMPGPVDPFLNIPKTFRARAGGLITVPVNLDYSEGLQSADFAISYDAERLEVVSVQRGRLTRDFDVMALNLDTEAGTIQVGMVRSAGAISGRGKGSVLRITFRVKADAPAGGAIINIRRDLGPTMTQLNDGDLDLIPDPSNEAGDILDGLIQVQAKRKLTPRTGVGNSAVSGLVNGTSDLFSLLGRKRSRGGLGS